MPLNSLETPEQLETPEEPVRIVQRFNEALNRHDVAAMMSLMSAHAVFDNTSPAPDGTRIEGASAIQAFWDQFFQQSPEARIEIEEIFGSDHRCVMRWRYEWVDPAGQAGHVRGADVYRISGGLITEKLSYVKG